MQTKNLEPKKNDGMSNNWIYTGEKSPGKEPGWFEVKDSGDETLRLYWGGIWFINSWFIDDKCKEKYRYYISYWRPIINP
jgi:hypothetical protein